MKKLFLIALFNLCVFTSVNAQNFKKISIQIDNHSQIETLQRIGIDHFHLEKDMSAELFVSENELQKISTEGLSYKVLIDDWKKHYQDRHQLTNLEKENFLQQSKNKYNVESFGFGSMGGFYNMDEIYNNLDSMRSQYPNIITEKISVGTSLEGRDIYVVKISDNPDVDEDEPEVFFNSLIHAREAQAMMTVMYYMYYLLENYGVDPAVTHLIDNREIYFMPIFNVDGFNHNVVNDPNGGGMWRKNRRNNADGSTGVDLNRNFGFHWGFNDVGSSPSPSSGTYRGTAAFSEPATQVVRDFCDSRNFVTGLNYHTYSNLLITPWGYIDQETPDSLMYREYASDMTQFNNYTWGTSSQIIYEVNGASDDWMYGDVSQRDRIITMTPEVGGSSDGFWPAQSRIFPLAQENVFSNLYITWVAGAYIGLSGHNFNQEYYDPGDNGNLSLSIKNKGLQAAANVTVDVVSLSSDIVISNTSITVGSILSRTIATNTPAVNFQIQNSASIGETYKLVVKSKLGSIVCATDTISFIVGTPLIVFQDDESTIATNWQATSNITNEKWETTTSTFSSGSESFTDSKNGDYSDDIINTLQLINPINLSGAASPMLWFDTKFDIEGDWDYGQVLVSTNSGSSWTALEGNLTNSGTGSFQPTGEPLYDGSVTNWSLEQIDLSAYEGNSILLKFVFKSDGGVTKDGWYIDNIRVVYYGQVPVELTSFTVTPIEKNIKLSWITATEINNNGFEIEKSTDKSEWHKFAFVKGNGSVSEKSNYNYIDRNPFNGKSFYRLVQVDYDGTKKYYDAVETDFYGAMDYNLKQNYPNPFNPSTVIEYTIIESGIVQLELFNLLGEKVATLINKHQEAGNHRVEFSANKLNFNLTSGIYFYTLKAGNFIETKKMMLMK